MKGLFISLLLTFVSLTSFSQTESEIKSILDSVISTTKETSYYSETVDWDSLSQAMHALSSNAKSIEELKPSFTLMLNTLRDHHGRIMSTEDFSILANFDDWSNTRNTDERERDQETWAVVNNIESRFEYRILPGNIGYLRIVGIGGNLDGQLEAERIRAALVELHKDKITNWIIDLRYNGGGNVNVMLAGIAPLLDSDTVATILDRDNEIQAVAQIIKGNFWYAGYNAFELKDKPKIKEAKIAVLTSRYTVSSGELVAVAFKGQDNVKFFGEATGGYTTNTGWSVINNQIALVIATGVYCDRNGKVYHENVEPNVEIEFEVEVNPTLDNAIIEASKWLLNP